MFAVFTVNIWLCLLSAFILIIVIDKLVHRYYRNSNIKGSIYQKIWVYFKPCLLMAEPRDHHNYIYMVWLVSILPVVYTAVNNITAHMVSRDVMHVDTIDDVLDDRLTVYVDYWTYEAFKSPGYSDYFPQPFRDKFIRMLQKLKYVEANMFIAYISDISKTSAYDKFKNWVIISNDIQALNMQSIIGTYMKFHIGQPDLVVPMTTLCYEPEFKFENVARTMYVV